jgi:hypothetical protein
MRTSFLIFFENCLWNQYLFANKWSQDMLLSELLCISVFFLALKLKIILIAVLSKLSNVFCFFHSFIFCSSEFFLQLFILIWLMNLFYKISKIYIPNKNDLWLQFDYFKFPNKIWIFFEVFSALIGFIHCTLNFLNQINTIEFTFAQFSISSSKHFWPKINSFIQSEKMQISIMIFSMEAIWMTKWKIMHYFNISFFWFLFSIVNNNIQDLSFGLDLTVISNFFLFCCEVCWEGLLPLLIWFVF